MEKRITNNRLSMKPCAKWKISILLLGAHLVLWLMLFVACSPVAAPTPAPVINTPAAPIIPAWQVQWENLVKAAKKEGIVNVVSSNPYRDLIAPFKQEFGITMENVVFQGANMTARINAERRAGIYTMDVGVIGLSTGFELKPEGSLDPLESVLLLPEVTDPGAWYKGEIPFADRSDKTLIPFFAFSMPPIGVNTNLVKAEEIKSFRDLLDPRWKGKIVFSDPTRTGTGNSAFVALLHIMGNDYMRELGKQVQILSDERLMIDWVAQGKVPIVLAPRAVTWVEFIQTGAPITTVIPTEGTWLISASGSVALLNKAPHPNAARLFINWLLSKKGQTIISRDVGYQSARVDVPTDFLPSFILRNPSVKYLDTISEEYQLRKMPEGTKMAKELFGPLLK